MIVIGGHTETPEELSTFFEEGSLERKMVTLLSDDDTKFFYSSLDELKFELRMRGEIIKAAYALYKSGMDFEVFRDARCNEKYWDRTDEGGFLLKDGVKASDAIRDIFENGRKYGTECATAMIIVYYGALLNLYPEELFNKLFPKIHLMDWHYIDRLLDEVGAVKKRKVYLPGDRRYFANPAVDQLTPEWQGENVIDLGNGKYYGHGVGILKAEEFISELNQHREEGAQESAHLLDMAGRPDFNTLYKYSLRGN